MDNTNLNIDLWDIWDLHIHSSASGDYFFRTCNKKISKPTNAIEIEKIKKYWVNKLITEIEKNKIKLISITDHNLFSENYYEEVKNALFNKNIEIIPGIEVDCFLLKKENNIAINNDYFQLIIHVNPNDYKKLFDFNDFFGSMAKMSINI